MDVPTHRRRPAPTRCSWTRRRRASCTVAAIAFVVIGCSGDDATSTTTVPIPGVPDRPVTTVVDASSAFCRGMLALVDAGDDPPTPAEVLDQYDRIAEDAPPEVAAAFAVVHDRVRALAAGTDVADVAAADAAGEELAIWVDTECRSTTVNPLPPPTEPGATG